MSPLKKDILLRELNWCFSKSSGPGGQHVNTTDSKAQVSWDFQKSEALNRHQKHLIEKKLQNYIKKISILQLSSSTHRSREMNKKECTSKLFNLLEKIAFKKEKIRRKTKPTRSSIEKRIKSKKNKSDVKKTRQKVKF